LAAVPANFLQSCSIVIVHEVRLAVRIVIVDESISGVVFFSRREASAGSVLRG
jgi:hypothetical protein